MIVLQDASLASVWEEVAGLRLVQPHHHLDRTWGDRRQHFWWRPGPSCPERSRREDGHAACRMSCICFAAGGLVARRLQPPGGRRPCPARGPAGLTCPAPSPVLVVLRLGAVPLAKP
jgi:hypothetical protein